MISGALAATVIGCSAQEAPEKAMGTPDPATAEARQAGTVNPKDYAGDVTLAFPASLPSRLGPVPIDVYAGLSSVDTTRLGLRTIADLRGVQKRLPELLSGDLDETCNQSMTINTTDVEADGDQVIVRGRVLARIYTCRRRDTPEESRGIRLISQRVDAVAIASAKVNNNCVEFDLVDLELDPSGLIGGIANLLGVTDRVRAAILQGADDLLEENPVCPQLPEGLRSLAPDYEEGGTREIGDGGMGVALVGSVDASASTLLSLLSEAQKRGIVEGQR